MSVLTQHLRSRGFGSRRRAGAELIAAIARAEADPTHPRDRTPHLSRAVVSLTERGVSANLPFVNAYQANGLSALGDPTRRAIFEHLAERPRAVGELAGELPVSRPAVSQHLKVLKDAGLVIDRKVGTRRLYQVDPQALADLRAYFDSFWDQSLAAFRDAAEHEEKTDG